MNKKICAVVTHVDNNNTEFISMVYYGDYPSVDNGVKSENQLTDDEIVKVKEFMAHANKKPHNTESIFEILNEKGYKYTI